MFHNVFSSILEKKNHNKQPEGTLKEGKTVISKRVAVQIQIEGVQEVTAKLRPSSFTGNNILKILPN